MLVTTKKWLRERPTHCKCGGLLYEKSFYSDVEGYLDCKLCDKVTYLYTTQTENVSRPGVYYIRGDITEASEPVIVHGCNAQGVMGSGVAKALRAKWPQIFPPYEQGIRSGRIGLGQILSVFMTRPTKKCVINAITQEHYGRDGRYVSYDAMDSVMHKVSNFLKVHAFDSVAMPKIGAGLGGGDWSIIESIIKAHLKDVEVYVYNND